MKKSLTSVSDVLVKALEAHGIQYVFGVPGEETEDILFSLAKSSITFIPTRHEQGAAFMANVWGRVTGKAGVCLSTLGPGATNLMTGLADAQLDKAPVVALTGQADSARLHKESHQYIDVVSMFKPITKWNTSVQNPAIIAEAISKAFKIAETEKPGVTHLDIPEDIAHLEALAEVIPPTIIRRGAPDYKAIAKTVELLKKAKKPIVLAGNGAIRKRASKQLRIFTEAFNIPVVSTFMGKGAISDREIRSLRSVGMQALDFSTMALLEADLIISVGFDIAELYPKTIHMINPKGTKKIVHIDFEQAEVYHYYQPTVEIISDISGALWELTEQLKKENLLAFSSWYSRHRTMIEKDWAEYTKSTPKPTVPFILNELRSVMHDEDIIISDVGAHKLWIGRNFPTYEPGTCIISNGLASMGISLPGGMAAKLAKPDVRVVSVMGDGGFMMNSQEIETAKRVGVPYVIVVLNDNNYGLISWKQTNHRGSAVGTTLSNPDFVKYAQSFGIKAYKPNNSSEVKKMLKKAIDSNELCLVSIDIDASENMRLTKKLAKNK